MNRNVKLLHVCILSTGLVAGTSLYAAVGQSETQQDPQTSSDQATQPDNTKMNKRDRNKQAVTADQQKETQADRELARKIRRAITKDSSLSTYAHNVKVIVRGGTVTLKGPVRTEDEKNAVGAKASEIAGADKVKNEIDVKS
ncbi:MAG TPA: BON domain-containing protein [Candidatus Dormibacteraeota bacterium]|nr:BON domain-containing protein [Candidatus Dormibacteraeota bacterium]